MGIEKLKKEIQEKQDLQDEIENKKALIDAMKTDLESGPMIWTDAAGWSDSESVIIETYV